MVTKAPLCRLNSRTVSLRVWPLLSASRCAFFFLAFIFLHTWPALAQEGSGLKAQNKRIKVPELWQTVEKSTSLSLEKRRRLAATLHDLVDKIPADQSMEKSNVYAALSVLHASDFLLMHSSLSFLVAAEKIWPDFVRTKYANYVWKQFLKYMARKQIVNEHLLSRVAGVLAAGNIMASESSEFPYYMGWSFFREEKYSDALGILEKVPIGSPHYRRSKFLEATSLVMLGRIADARESYQIVVSLSPSAAEDRYGIPRRSIQRLRDLSVVNVARLLYEQSQFKESLAYYRAIDQDSFFFYESLAEQGWSFFMAGYPTRALGAAYAATSPFYSDRFNPDVYFLFATLYFWLCQYDYAEQALSGFINHAQFEGDSLRVFISGVQKLAAAQKSERLLAVIDAVDQGLNPKNIGLGPKTLAFLKGQEGLMDSYQGFLALRGRRLRVQNLRLEKTMQNRVLTAIEEYEDELKKQVSLQAEDALVGLRDDYDHALGQSRLLWLEILTAQKDKILGNERSVQGNQFVGTEKNFVDALTKGKETSWRQDKYEFWFDELGSYVFDTKSKCFSSSAQVPGGSAPK